MKILIIDDDREDAELLNEAILDFSPAYECLIAGTAESARVAFSTFVPKVVFLDSMMQPVSGMEILEESVKIEALKETQFVVMSGSLRPGDYARYTGIGANFVIAKPASYKSLLAFVHHVLSPFSINKRVKLMTTDALVHNHRNSLQALLNRELIFEAILNNSAIQGNLQFLISELEVRKIKSELGYDLLVQKGGHWLPEM